MTKGKDKAPEGVIIAEMTGRAGNDGRLHSVNIEAAMQQAALDLNAKGIADDTPAERVVELLGDEFAGMTGTEVIRAAKINARNTVKRQAREAAEAERLAAEEAAAKG